MATEIFIHNFYANAKISERKNDSASGWPFVKVGHVPLVHQRSSSRCFHHFGIQVKHRARKPGLRVGAAFGCRKAEVGNKMASVEFLL